MIKEYISKNVLKFTNYRRAITKDPLVYIEEKFCATASSIFHCHTINRPEYDGSYNVNQINQYQALVNMTNSVEDIRTLEIKIGLRNQGHL